MPWWPVCLWRKAIVWRGDPVVAAAAVSLSVIMGCRRSCRALDRYTQLTPLITSRCAGSRTNFLISVVALFLDHGMGHAVARGGTGSRRFGEVLAIGAPGCMASGDAFCVAIGLRVLRARLPQLVGRFSGPPVPSFRRWCGRRCICNTTGSFSAKFFDRPFARVPPLPRQFDVADGVRARPQ